MTHIEKKLDSKKTVFIIDGSSFLYRAFYALKPMFTIQGEPIGAVFGFCRMMKKLIDTFNPEYMLVAWDMKGATERHELFPDYKATRQAAPQDLFVQKDHIQKFADAIGLLQVSKQGVEADDIMYSLAQDFAVQGYHVVLVTTDKDMGQMVNHTVVLYDSFKEQFYGREELEQKYGFPPEKLPFYFALIGDSSDNIPGVKGIGPKGATDLVQQFLSLHDLYEHINLVPKERMRQLLLENKDNALLSEQLFLLRYHPLAIAIEQSKFSSRQWVGAQPLFQELGFKSLLKEMPAVEQPPASVRYGLKFIAISQADQLQQLCAAIKKAGQCAIDTETDGLNAYQAGLVGISLCYEAGTAYYIPLCL